jgi:hypothetical protein
VPPIGAQPQAGGDLIYHGGPVMHTNKTYAIYWVPAGYSMTASYKSTINQYFTDVAAASGATSNVYAVETQYYDLAPNPTPGNVQYSSTVGGSVTDTGALPANGCPLYNGLTACLSDTQLIAKIHAVTAAQGWTENSTNQFFLFTPQGIGSCFDSQGSSCAYTAFCAYHGYDSNLIYANQPYAAAPGCDTGERPNGDAADATINVTSHEHREAINDFRLNAWWDPNTGEEGSDKCAWNFGSPINGPPGARYNQTINGHNYYLQQEWSNDPAAHGCRLNYGGAPPPGFCSRAGDVLTVDVPSDASITIGRSGTNFNVTGGGNPDPGCGGSNVNNVNMVNVNGTGGNETVTFDTSGGNFEPGATPEGTGISEIEFNVSLGSGTDTLIAQLGALADKFTIGSTGINPNNDADADLTLSGVENLSVKGGNGNDAISAAGANGAGSAFSAPVTIAGEGGRDTLTGGLGNDSIDGGASNDTFKALNVADGADDFVGGAGLDTANYGARPASGGGVTVDPDNVADDGTKPAGEGDNIHADVEKVTGSKGGDTIDDGGQVVQNVFKGGGGNDTINTVDGVSNDTIDGGGGTGDTCTGDPGDSITNCP